MRNGKSREKGDGLQGLADELMRSSRKKKICYFITGTDTGVGKTRLALSLIREFKQRGLSAVGFKPICCGDRNDAIKLWKLAGGALSMDDINPIHLPKPMAPLSQESPPWPMILKRVRKAFVRLSRKHQIILIEGAGGLLCPLDTRRTLRDLAKAFHWPIVMVTMNRLGVLNHTLLTLEAARAGGLKPVAIFLNSPQKGRDPSRKSNASALRRLTRLPVYGS